jgi:signal transduction histidine kinase
MKIITPYIAWALENGQTFISLGDEQKMLEKERYVHQQHLIENKQQNIVKKACLFIVTSITPYIDRISNEVHKLIALDYLHNDRIKQEKYTYINELVNSINEYNDILSLWIKMRQGSLNLNIENFELNPLFEIVSKNRKSFEIKQQQLTITPTTAIVKADKALTLFMINTLMDNARKYTPKGGKVDVFANETDSYVEISIQDNGPGLSEEDRSHILNEKVYDSQKIGMQGVKDTNELQTNKGYGFGLMNCKGIIEKYKKTNPLFHVCSFDIDSKVGEGSRFFFRLPKGVQKVMYICLALLLPCFTACMEDYTGTSEQALTEADSIQYNDQ